MTRVIGRLCQDGAFLMVGKHKLVWHLNEVGMDHTSAAKYTYLPPNSSIGYGKNVLQYWSYCLFEKPNR